MHCMKIITVNIKSLYWSPSNNMQQTHAECHTGIVEYVKAVLLNAQFCKIWSDHIFFVPLFLLAKTG